MNWAGVNQRLFEYKWIRVWTIECESAQERMSERIRLNLWACSSAVVFRGGAFLTVIGPMRWPTRLWRWGRCSPLGSREDRAADIWVWTFPSVPTRRTPSMTTATGNKYFSSSGDTLASVLSCTCVYFCILRPCSHLTSFLTRKSWQERFFSKIKSWQRFGYK